MFNHGQDGERGGYRGAGTPGRVKGRELAGAGTPGRCKGGGSPFISLLTIHKSHYLK